MTVKFGWKRKEIRWKFCFDRLEQGNTSNVKSLGDGVFELKIDFGPGYRIYFSYESNAIIILLGGGTKQRQQDDIKQAKERWKYFKTRKK